VVPGVLPHGAEIACSSSACLENVSGDWRSWEDSSPVDRLLVLPAAGNPLRRFCNRGR
jgi:hypothetical protein